MAPIPDLDFQFYLLSRMTADYRRSVLDSIGVPESEEENRASRYAKASTKTMLDIGMYKELLGHPAALQSVSDPALAHYTACCFVLTLWSHLFWVVYDPAPECGLRPAIFGFQNQTELAVDIVDPSVVRPGEWTLTLLERVAESVAHRDGWGEQAEYDFKFGDRVFRGNCVFELLQSWHEVTKEP